MTSMSPLNEHFSILIFLDFLPTFNIVDHSLLLRTLSSLACSDISHVPLTSFLPLCLLLPVSFSFIFFFLNPKCWHFSRLGSKCFSFLILYCLPMQCHTYQMFSSMITDIQMTPRFMWLAQISTLSRMLTYSAIFSLHLLECIKGIQTGNV